MTVQKWSLRPLLDSPKGGLNIGILLYIILFVLFWVQGPVKPVSSPTLTAPGQANILEAVN